LCVKLKPSPIDRRRKQTPKGEFSGSGEHVNACRVTKPRRLSVEAEQQNTYTMPSAALFLPFFSPCNKQIALREKSALL
jgi:hypothetical protein